MGVVYHAKLLRVVRSGAHRSAARGGLELPGDGSRGLRPAGESKRTGDYKQPARYDDEIEVRASGALISAVRVEFTYDVVRTGDSTTLATRADGTTRRSIAPDTHRRSPSRSGRSSA